MEKSCSGALVASGEKPDFHCASISWGAASVAMLFRLLADPKLKLNMVIFVNTGFEFSAIYHTRDRILPLLKASGVEYVEIDVSEMFIYQMFARQFQSKETGEGRVGYGWCGGPCRFGTRLKLDALKDYYRKELNCYHVIEYVGITADEKHRCEKNALFFTQKVYPLVDAEVSKKAALLECYRKGYYWEEETDYGDTVYLYELLDNVSCAHCRNKNLKELKRLYFLFPKKYWQPLRELQMRFPDMPMKGEGKSVFDLERRFSKEGYRISIFDIMPYPKLLQMEMEEMSDENQLLFLAP